MQEQKQEKSLIILIARSVLSQKQKIEFCSLLARDLDYDYLIRQIKRHKLLPLFINHLKSCKIENSSLQLCLKEEQAEYEKRLKLCRILDIELCKIKKLFLKKNISYAVLKGPILAHSIYDSLDKRTYNDLDILVKKSDINVVSNIFKKQGYIQGDWDNDKKEIIPAPREMLLTFNLLMHELYTFRKMINQSLVSIDLHKELHVPYRKNGQPVFNVDTFLNSSCWPNLENIKLCGEQISTLKWTYFLLQLCMHAYIDEVSPFNYIKTNGGNLRAYCDIRELILLKRSSINFDQFVDLVQEIKVNELIYYILANLSELYDDMQEILASVLFRMRPNNLDFMNEFGYSMEVLGEQRGRYSKPFIERIFDNSPQEDFERQKHLFRRSPLQSQLEFLRLTETKKNS
jgi:hypothetical protein